VLSRFSGRQKILTIDQHYIYNVVVSDVLGTFEQAVLLALVRLRKDAYGRAILKEVQQRLRREVAAGAVYATLDRLEAKMLISSRLGSGTPIRAGRPRRYYSIETAGIRALNEAKVAVESMWQGFGWPLKGGA
jgi:PadR family transcriptional regulator PadR